MRPTWRPGFERLLAEAGLADAYSSIIDVNTEDLFLAQTLRLTRGGGRIGVIVPDGTISGRRSEGLRRKLLHAHRIDRVVQLPRGSFQDTDAQAFILVLTKGIRPNKTVRLLRFDPLTGLSPPLSVDLECAQTRLDYDYHFARVQRPTFLGKLLSSIVTDVRRGSLTSSEIKNANFPVFHTNGFNHLDSDIHLSGRFKASHPEDFPATAEPGDILIARVDRKLHLKVGIVSSGRAVISDCVWRVRVPSRYRNIVLAALRSPTGIAYLNSVARGVSARILTKSDLLAMPIPVPGQSRR
jgi:type I restriction enzyme M protein